MSQRLLGVIMKEKTDYMAKVLLDGGQVEEYPIAGSPMVAAPYNEHLALVLRDGRAISLNWSKVILIDFIPSGEKEVTHVLPEDTARELIASGAAREDGLGLRIL